MKKGLLILLVAVLAVASSCSKDAKINRRLDGEWQVVTIGGLLPEFGWWYTFKFIKEDKLTGKGTRRDKYFDSINIPSTFTYSVLDQKTTLVFDGTAEIWLVTKIEKNRMEMVDSDGDVWVLDPK